MNVLGGLLFVFGCLVWFVGSNIVLAQAGKRLGLRWPTIFSLLKLTRTEAIKIAGLLIVLIACYFAFVLLRGK